MKLILAREYFSILDLQLFGDNSTRKANYKNKYYKIISSH